MPGDPDWRAPIRAAKVFILTIVFLGVCGLLYVLYVELGSPGRW